MQIHTSFGVLPTIVILADGNPEGKLNSEQIKICKQTKQLLEEARLLSESTYVLNENTGGAPETTGLLFEGLEHIGMHEDSFPSWNDEDETMHSMLATIRTVLSEKPQQLCIVCGSENSFQFMYSYFNNN